MERTQIEWDEDSENLLEWAVHNMLSPDLRSLAAKCQLTDDDMKQLARMQLFKSPPPAGLAKSTAIGWAMKWSVSSVCMRLKNQSNPSLHTRSLGAVFGATNKHDTAKERTAGVDLAESIGIALKSLGPRARLVIALRYGLGDGFDFSVAEIATILGLSMQRVGQIERVALARLRRVKALEIWGDAD